METKPDVSGLLTKNTHNLLAARLLQESTNGQVVEQTRPIAIREVRDIFRSRARRNESLGGPIQGFPELMEGLEAFTADAVVIYSVHSETGSYKIFADESLSQLAGVLKFPAVPQGEPLRATTQLQAA